MQKHDSLNIYLEAIIPNISKEQVWNNLFESKEFQALFMNTVPEFEQGHTGHVIWRKYLFFNVLGVYEVESYNKNMHLLLKISAEEFSSLLLITTEENRQGILFRLDHRSFFGKHSDYFQKLFFKRWKKTLRFLSHSGK